MKLKKLEIMEQGIGFFQDLRDLMQDLSEQGKSLSDAIIKVRRRGTGKDDTSYRLDIEEIKPMSDKEVEAVSKKINLQEYFKPHTIEQITRIINGEAWEDAMRSDYEDNEDIEVR